ncbi:transcription repressor OFP13 [Phoenix dactylifera]|uniref:Transcription repressor n=1 Tax=Phoenix dactylifera TaxID=42345 RepID=A0A8B7MWR9_PHODC|nr:transcription repressor OFP13 [Phoenix dactylifera]
MGRKLGLTSLFFKTRDTRPSPSSMSSSPSSSWAWPSCKQPRTLSFRAVGDGDGDAVHKTVRSAHFDSSESCFTTSSAMESESFSTVSEASGGETVEAVIRGLRSDRLFFEPGSTSSILEEASVAEGVPFEGSVAMAMDSKDPYWDFKVSMEEMVLAHGVKDLGWLEEMLGWYLRVNGKWTHEFIVGAFLDVLLGLASPSPCSSFTFQVEEKEEGNGLC